MKPVVVITQKVHKEVIDYLEEYCTVVKNESCEPLSRNELIERCNNAQAIMVFMPDMIDDEFLAACPKLRIVGAALKGYDNFDITACTQRGIWFTIVPDLLTPPTADLAVGLLLCLTRHILEGDRYVRSESFHGWRPHLYGTGLSKATAGIIGMGAVGQEVALRLRSFNIKILCYDIKEISQDVLEPISARGATLEELLRNSDFVFPLVPLLPSTMQMLNRDRIAMMKSGAYLINVGRGSVVDEAAVTEALASDHLAGYAADVFQSEDWAQGDRPRAIAPELLAQKDRTVFTPHVGSAVKSVRLAIEMDTAHNIIEALQGKLPHGSLNQIRS
jgi:phosphonate dehydrogenase